MPAISTYGVQQVGAKNTPSFKLYVTKENKPLSPFHDVPLHCSDVPNADCLMVVEIAKWTNAKLEISKGLPLNPIKQDIKKDKLRYVKNVFPFHGYPWSYGALPQTWENPTKADTHTQCLGDNDPLDVVEISGAPVSAGAVLPVKVLGCMALLDEGETDWKILAIDATHPLADKLNGPEDIEREMPGLVDGTRRWFRVYKVPDGKPVNHFAFDGACQDRQFALKVIQEAHREWQDLYRKGHEGIVVSKEADVVDLGPAEPDVLPDPAVLEYHYVRD
jgi:inorganic pyrophosphatase